MKNSSTRSTAVFVVGKETNALCFWPTINKKTVLFVLMPVSTVSFAPLRAGIVHVCCTTKKMLKPLFVFAQNKQESAAVLTGNARQNNLKIFVLTDVFLSTISTFFCPSVLHFPLCSRERCLFYCTKMALNPNYFSFDFFFVIGQHIVLSLNDVDSFQLSHSVYSNYEFSCSAVNEYKTLTHLSVLFRNQTQQRSN